MTTIFDKIRENKNDEKNIALFYKGRNFTYKDFNINVAKTAKMLKSIGIKEGDVVTLSLPNIPSCIYSLYALNSIGAIINILHPLTQFNTVIEKMDYTNSKYAILLETLYKDNIDFIKKSDKTFIFANPVYDDGFFKRHFFYFKYCKAKNSKNVYNFDDFRKYEEEKIFENIDGTKTAFLIHSGGTTGDPKIIELSTNSVIKMAKSKAVEEALTSRSVLGVLPIFHTFGLNIGIISTLYRNGTVYLMPKFNAKETLEAINKNKLNVIIGIPAMIKKLAEEKNFNKTKFSNLKACFIGGDKANLDVIESFNKILKDKNSECKICEGYGLTEASCVISTNTNKDYKIESVGKPLETITIKIFNEDGEEVKTGEVGEICVSGERLMNKYFKDEEGTKKSIVEINGIRWLKTGDCGYIDEDGFLFLKGRKKRIFKISGVSIYPVDVENIAMEFKDDITNSSLEFFAEPKPHMILFLIKNKNSQKDNNEIIKEIYSAIKSKTIKYNWPENIVFVKEFPMTNLGKIDHKKFVDLKQTTH